MENNGQTSHLAAALMASPSPMTRVPDFLNKMPHDMVIERPTPNSSQPNFKGETNDDEENKSATGSAEEISDEESNQLEIGKDTPGRGITLQMLLKDSILKPGKAAMTIEYLGQKFVGDLLNDGKIKSHETETIFCSPSAWAIHCKRIINPDKRSGCGWASVKYRGKKLDTIKATYLRKKQLARENAVSDDEMEMENENPPEPPPQRSVFKHNAISSRMVQHDVNTLVEAVQFSTLGKVQPFLVNIYSNALLILDLHSHLKTKEICGYLGGHWDQNNQSLNITHTFPCLVDKRENKPFVLIEAQIQEEMENLDLIPVGWYHSHPLNPAMPTLQDCDKQLDFQMKMRGPSDHSYKPCVGIICSPYNSENATVESTINCFYCLPPPDQKPAEYPRPILKQFNISHDTHLTNETMNQIRKTIKFYLKYQDDFCVDFHKNFTENVTFLEKLNASLKSKFPKGQSDGLMWHFIKDELGYSSENQDKIDLDALLAVPQAIPIQKSNSPTSMMSSLDHSSHKKKDGKDANSEMEALLDMTSRLSNSLGGKADTTSKFPSKLDVYSSMSVGGNSISNSGSQLNSNSLDSISTSKLLSDLTAGLPANLAASFSSNKLMDPASYAQTLQSMASGKDSVSNLMNPIASLASSLGSNLLMNPVELADVLYGQRKYSNNSLLGIPDPLSKSTLAANNMFLSPALFNLSESLMKPHTTSGSPKSSNSSKKNSSLYKAMKDYLPPDFNMAIDKKDGNEMAANPKKDKSFEESHLGDVAKNIYFSQLSDLSKQSSNNMDTSDYSLEALKLMNSFSAAGQGTSQSSVVNSSNSTVNRENPTNYSSNLDN